MTCNVLFCILDQQLKIYCKKYYQMKYLTKYLGELDLLKQVEDVKDQMCQRSATFWLGSAFSAYFACSKILAPMMYQRKMKARGAATMGTVYPLVGNIDFLNMVLKRPEICALSAYYQLINGDERPAVTVT
jgi:hypothetical protein